MNNLKIPQWVANHLDTLVHLDWGTWQFFIYSDEFPEELAQWLDGNDEKENLIKSQTAIAYLNPLTRNLVEVV